MKYLTRAGTIAVVLLSAVPSLAQSLTPAEIDAAIKAGLAGKKLSAECGARGGMMSAFDPLGGFFDVYVEGPVGRIMRTAGEAKKKYQPFTEADVTEEMLAPTLSLVATPQAPTFSGGSWTRTAPADHVVLKRKDAKGDNPADVLQPTSHEFLPATWSNAIGGKWECQGIAATFDLAAFKAMSGDEIDIVVVTGAGERRCKIGKKDRIALR